LTIDGTYNCEAKTLLGTFPVKITLTSAGLDLNVLCSTQWGDKTVAGKVTSDNQIAFSSYVTSPLGEIFLEVEAKITGDNLSGKVKAGKLGTAPFKGKRAG
jgi:hypothetical protein